MLELDPSEFHRPHGRLARRRERRCTRRPCACAQAKPKLVVIGGGPGGGTVARYVDKEAAGAIDVTLIEPQKKFTTCFFSNLYVGGFRSFDSITHDYDKVAHAGRPRRQRWAPLDRPRRASMVVLAGGRACPYDRLVVAPGIDLKWDRFPAIRRRPPRPCRMPGRPGAQTAAAGRAASMRSRTAISS